MHQIIRVTIYRAKFIGIVSSKFLPRSWFRYNPRVIKYEIPLPIIKLNRVNTNFPVQALQ